MIQKNVLHSLNVNTLFCIICLHSLKYRIYNKKEKVTPFFATFSFVLFLFYCPWVPVPPEVFSEVPSDPIASSALCAEYAACVPG